MTLINNKYYVLYISRAIFSPMNVMPLYINYIYILCQSYSVYSFWTIKNAYLIALLILLYEIQEVFAILYPTHYFEHVSI